MCLTERCREACSHPDQEGVCGIHEGGLRGGGPGCGGGGQHRDHQAWRALRAQSMPPGCAISCVIPHTRVTLLVECVVNC